MDRIRKIILLGPHHNKIMTYLSSLHDEVITTEESLEKRPGILEKADFIISYGYRFIIRKEVLDKFKGKAINLHYSYLPWNRGADPNLWSFLEDSPKGVTIHYLDDGIDTGDIIAQKEVAFKDDETLRSSYEKLSCEIEELFIQKWRDICSGSITPLPQPTGGSFHRLKDRRLIEHLLVSGWDTPVAELIGKAREKRLG